MRTPLISALLLASLPLLTGCGQSEERAGNTPDLSRADDGRPSSSDDDRIITAGAAAAAALTGELIARVTAAIAEGGPAHAIEFCSEEACR